MSQVTIYLEEETLVAAKAAAARAQMSVSRWFAQFAEAELKTNADDRVGFWQEIDALRGGVEDDGLDFLLASNARHLGMGTDIPRESFE